MPPRSRRLAVLVGGWALALIGACSTFGSEEDERPAVDAGADATTVDTSPDGGDASTSDAAEPTDASSDGLAPLPCADAATLSLPLQADAPIASGAPDQPRGTDVSVCNMFVAACLFRFTAPPAVVTAIRAPGAARLALTLTRANVHTECVSDMDCAKATFRQQGALYVSPLNPLWNESTVTWNSKEAGNPWGGAGATKVGVDILAQAGSVFVPATTTVARVDLDPQRWNLSFLGGGLIAVRTTFQNGGSPSAFVAVLRETSGSVAPVAPPQLEVTYCP